MNHRLISTYARNLSNFTFLLSFLLSAYWEIHPIMPYLTNTMNFTRTTNPHPKSLYHPNQITQLDAFSNFIFLLSMVSFPVSFHHFKNHITSRKGLVTTKVYNWRKKIKLLKFHTSGRENEEGCIRGAYKCGDQKLCRQHKNVDPR